MNSNDSWPFERQDPDCVTLGVHEGREPSDKPPVRIFLGTEEAQYRAERVFFFSIEKFRDPSRVYEIYLMKNLKGFDRKSWRTGFTNYRYAIPSLAGDEGRAIYNDVDQIYLADPALLFDLDMGDHGFLAIHAKDTSVMVMDCRKMLPFWNRETASTKSKKELINGPDSDKNLYGHLDGHWNARDVEYVEGRTNCLHYTALHQQPWEPFPGIFSYHPNPLAYIWHDLEREADELGFHLFSCDSPSPELVARKEAVSRRAIKSDLVKEIEAFGVQSILYVSMGGSAPVENLPSDVSLQTVDLKAGGSWPEGRFDLVLVDEIFDNLPPVDIGWLLESCFRSAGNYLWACVFSTSSENPHLGSAEWWRQRLDDAARPHPEISLRLDVSGSAQATYHVKKQKIANEPVVWALLGTKRDAEVESLARGLGWRVEQIKIDLLGGGLLPAWLQNPNIDRLTAVARQAIKPPWPDLVVAGSREAANVARWIKDQSGGQTRLVQIGQPGASFSFFDLILAAPGDRLPMRRNVMHTSAPFAVQQSQEADAAADEGRAVLILRSPDDGFELPPPKCQELARLLRDKLGGDLSRLTILVERGCDPSILQHVQAELGPDVKVMRASDGISARSLVADSDFVIVTGDNLERMADAVVARKKLAYLSLKRWYETKPVVSQITKVLGLLTGGGRTYRGTPYQQHVVGRLIDELATRGIKLLPKDYAAYHQALRARGLAIQLDDTEQVAAPKPLSDLENAVRRVRSMMAQTARQN